MNIRRFIPVVLHNNLVMEHRIAKRLDRYKNKKVLILMITASLIIYNLTMILL